MLLTDMKKATQAIFILLPSSMDKWNSMSLPLLMPIFKGERLIVSQT